MERCVVIFPDGLDRPAFVGAGPLRQEPGLRCESDARDAGDPSPRRRAMNNASKEVVIGTSDVAAGRGFQA